MKPRLTIYITLCLGVVLSSTAEELILNKKQSVIISPISNQIYFFFNSESFSIDNEILFQIKSLKGSLDSLNVINYQFVSSTNEINVESTPSLSANIISESTDIIKLVNQTEYQLKYFKIQKSEGKYIFIKFGIGTVGDQSIYVEITNMERIPGKSSINPSGVSDNQYLKKYKSITVDSSVGYIFFDASDFDEGEEMYFKIKAYEYAYIDYYSDGIYYDFINNDDSSLDYSNSNYLDFSLKVDFEYDTYDERLKIKYFTIKKDKRYFNGGDGKLLSISFYFDYGPVTITNTETDEGKLKGWEIALIVVACVIVIGIAIFIICWRRRKAAIVAMNMNRGYPQGPMPPVPPY